MIKMKLRKSIDKGARVRQYFLRGHGNWFALAFSLINFTLIFYNLLFINLYFVPEILKSYSFFFIIFGICYFPVATCIGWLDFRKGTYKEEQRLSLEISPIWQEVFKKFNNLEATNQEVLIELQRLKEK
ncbi:MAG: hypothetical protein ACW964_11800 [Candidatus Hodarchaeales archaeon]|jgi:hypothetical protein